MKKLKTALRIIITLAIIISGCFIPGYLGGFLSGSATAILLLTTLGRWQYSKALRRINRLQEHLYKNMIQ